MSSEGELWHIVEAKRDDGTPTMFRIRELPPQKQLTKIFVVELPYPTPELSRLPDAAAYRRLAEFDEQWLRPACASLGWELVGSKTEDGSFFLYMYGASDPGALIQRLSPFDGALGFYDDDDPDWSEYGTLRELLDQAKAIPVEVVSGPEVTVPAKVQVKRKAKPTKAPAKAKKKVKAKKKPAKAKAKSTQKLRKVAKRKKR